MTIARWFLLFLLATGLLSGCTGTPKGVTPVQGFQAERYLGTWYEIARLDHSFERGLVDVSARYQRRADGGIDVLNSGYHLGKQAWKEAKGRAYFIDSPQTGSLKVSFFGPFYGAYHVMALDPDYRWAMVAGPSHDYLWILARTPSLPEAVVADLLENARQAGFDLSSLIRVSQQQASRK
jgi:apolipoprotein D and lipocalin family protein